MLEKQRQKIYEESEKERQKNAKVNLDLALYVDGKTNREHIDE